MPTVAQVPILVWKDASGRYTAALVQDFENAATVGTTVEDAVRQMREFAAWAVIEQGWRVETELEDPRLVTVRVEARPEFQWGGRRFSADRAVTLEVPCVWARDVHRGLVGSLPTLGMHFEFADPAALRELVAHYAQSAVQGLGPREMASRLRVQEVQLRTIPVRVHEPVGSKEKNALEGIEALSAVAEPVLGPRGAQARLGPAWERAELAEAMVSRLRQGRANLLVVGEAGVGKTMVIVEALRRLAREPAGGTESESTQTILVRRFWLTSAARLIAGMQYLGQWEARCEEVIAELSEMGGVLCVENLLDLVRVGGSGPGDSVAAFLLPYLARGEVRLMAEVRPSELEACRRLLPGIADVFEMVAVPALTPAQAVGAVRRMTLAALESRRLEAAPGAIEMAVRLFQRFQPGEPPPGAASVFLRRIVDRLSRETRAASARSGEAPRAAAPEAGAVGGGMLLDIARVWREFTRQTGLPEVLLRDDVPLPHEEVRGALEARIAGQPAACDIAAGVVTRLKAGLNDPRRPLATLLFCGPTGVGKTALAQALAGYLFGHGQAAAARLVRLDMSEYGGPTAADRFLERPDGEPATWLARVRQQPFVVLLLDEIEKAAAEVFDLLLGLLDEGRLTDRFGRTTSFQSAVVILTSNLGARGGGALGFGEGGGPDYDAEARGFFRPEFFNRLDAVVTFQPLGSETVRAIARLELEAVARREGLVRSGIRLSWDPAVEAHLAWVGFDRRYGARPLQRAVEREVVRPLAGFLLRHAGVENREVHGHMTDGRIAFRLGGDD